MSLYTRLSFALVAAALIPAAAHGGVVDGNCYLEGKTNHCCTKVEIDGSAVHAAAHTDSSGHYGWAWVVGGWHTFTYSHPGYEPETHEFWVNLGIHTQLPEVTLETKAICDPPSWQHYPYTIPGTGFTFPYVEGRHDPFLTYPIEWWYVNFHLTDEDACEHAGFVAFFKFPHMVLMSIITLDQGIMYSKAKYPVLFDTSDQYLCIEAGTGPPDRWCNRQCEGDFIPFEYELFVSWVDDSGGIVWLDLDMGSLKSPLPVGGDGFVEFDNLGWSYYYSHPRVDLVGKLHLPLPDWPLLGKDVQGYGWIDHQWASFIPGVIRWEWLSIQLDDDREIMVADTWVDEERLGSFSGGLNLYDESCSLEILEDYTLRPLKCWTDPETGRIFGTKWRVMEPSREIDLTITADFDHQIMRTTGQIVGARFWEGACTVSGEIDGQPVEGTAFAEITHDMLGVLGDLNCDGAVNAFDIDPFVQCLVTGVLQPGCTCDLADINGDGKLDSFDIDPFVELLTGG